MMPDLGASTATGVIFLTGAVLLLTPILASDSITLRSPTNNHKFCVFS